MKITDYLILAWLIVVVSSMIYMSVNMWISNRRNKKEAAARNKRNEEIDTKLLEYLNAQIAAVKNRWKEPWQ